MICPGRLPDDSALMNEIENERTPDRSLKHARELLESFPLIDGHNDLPWSIRKNPSAPGDVEAFDLSETAPGDTDLPRLREGLVGAQFWSVFLPGEIAEQGYSKVQLEQFDIALRMIERYPETLALALTADDIEAAFENGKIASLIGMEGGHALENSLGALRAFYRLGARYLTLTHNVTLDWVDAAMDAPRHHGLSAFGKELIREMNRLGMMVDLSHVSPDAMSDALDVTEAPVIFSHSSARALTDHPRNVPDTILERMPENGGIVMVTFIPAFVSEAVAEWEEPVKQLLTGTESHEEIDRVKSDYAKRFPMPRATLEHVADHIDYVRRITGIEHVGIGSDFWGSEFTPVGLEDTSRFPHLIAELIRRGWTDTDLEKLAGGNILRVFRAAESAAERIQQERPPSTATIEKLDGYRP